ncbi:hypothetical protein HT031_001661 [Scenedesmus sp. PABB004]|nr:hypothetical protein HT031_001661 [Scenedesmus sp. PABB004]
MEFRRALALAALALLAGSAPGADARRSLHGGKHDDYRPNVPAPPCAQVNLTSVTPTPLGVFGWSVAMSTKGDALAISAPGEGPEDYKKLTSQLPWIASRGAVYVSTATGRVKSKRAAPEHSSKGGGGHGGKPPGPSSCPTYRPLTALVPPATANGYGQGFGQALAMSADGSVLIVALAGCYVPPGGLPPLCPSFPPAVGAAPGSPPSGNYTWPLAPPTTSCVVPDAVPVQGWLAGLGLPCSCVFATGGVPVWPIKCVPDAVATPPVNPVVPMDFLWVYRRQGDGTYKLDTTASAGLKILGPTVTKQNQIDQPNLFYYTTNRETWPSISAKGDVVAVNADIAYLSKDSQNSPLSSASGVHVFRKSGDTYVDVLRMKAIYANGSLCPDEIGTCYSWTPLYPAISPNGQLLATVWGGMSPADPVSLHVWDGRKFVPGLVLPFEAEKDGVSSANPAFSANSAVLGLGMLVPVNNTLEARIDLRVLYLRSDPVTSAPNLTAALACSIKVPGYLNPLTGEGIVSSLEILQLPGRGNSAVMRVAASVGAAPTLVYDIPFTLARSGAVELLSCPTKPTASVDPPSEESTFQGWGSGGSQACSINNQVLGGIPGAVGRGNDKPLPAAGAAVIVGF